MSKVRAINRPLISVALPVRDCVGTIGPAVRSILAQNVEDWELLLIDDGSIDGTAEIVQGFSDRRIRTFVDGRRLGLSARLNQAVTFSRGDFFARMDGDDVAYPWRFERQLAYLRPRPQVDLVGAGLLVFRGDGEVLGKRPAPESHAAIVAHPTSGFPIAHPTFFGRLGFFQSFGYRLEATRMEDQDLLRRAYHDGIFANVPELLLGYREDQLSLPKILATRRSFARRFAEGYLADGRPDRAARVMVEQGLKAAVDVAAIQTGLGYRLLRHRAAPVTDGERAEWDAVWRAIAGARAA
jgi:glycosyltransferase involved in cell wall biosynthesis